MRLFVALLISKIKCHDFATIIFSAFEKFEDIREKEKTCKFYKNAGFIRFYKLFEEKLNFFVGDEGFEPPTLWV